MRLVQTEKLLGILRARPGKYRRRRAIILRSGGIVLFTGALNKRPRRGDRKPGLAIAARAWGSCRHPFVKYFEVSKMEQRPDGGGSKMSPSPPITASTGD